MGIGGAVNAAASSIASAAKASESASISQSVSRSVSASISASISESQSVSESISISLAEEEARASAITTTAPNVNAEDGEYSANVGIDDFTTTVTSSADSFNGILDGICNGLQFLVPVLVGALAVRKAIYFLFGQLRRA